MSQAMLALFIALPISFSIAAITSVARFDASKSALPPPPESEEDLVDQALLEDTSVKRLPLWQLCMYALIGFSGPKVLEKIPGVTIDMVILFAMAGMLAACAESRILQITFGLVPEIECRRRDGILYLGQYTPSLKQNILVVWPMRVIPPFFLILLHYTTIPPFVVYLVLAIVYTFRFSTLFNDTKEKSQTLKVVVFVFCGIIFSTVGIVGVVFGVVQSRWGQVVGSWIADVSKSITSTFSKNDPSIESKDQPSQVVDPSMINMMLYIQILVLIGFTGGVLLSALYRIDTVIARGGNPSPSPSPSSSLSTSAIDVRKQNNALDVEDCEGPNEVPKGCGHPVRIPSVWQMVKERKERGLVVPKYALVGMVIILWSVGCSRYAVDAVCSMDCISDSKECNADYQTSLLLGIMITVLISPFLIALAVATMSWFNGESNFVWNYRADWSVPLNNGRHGERGGEVEFVEKMD